MLPVLPYMAQRVCQRHCVNAMPPAKPPYATREECMARGWRFRHELSYALRLYVVMFYEGEDDIRRRRTMARRYLLVHYYLYRRQPRDNEFYVSCHVLANQQR